MTACENLFLEMPLFEKRSAAEKSVFDKNKPKIFYVLCASLIIALVIIVLNSLIAGFVGRYALDMAAFIIIPSLFCAYYWCQGPRGATPVLSRRLIASYALIIASIFTGLFLFVKGTPFVHFDHTLYRYLEYSLGIIRDV
jgi:hypothetical protein